MDKQIDRNQCPMCGSHDTIETTQQNGPDDFDYVFECKTCGYNASN